MFIDDVCVFETFIVRHQSFLIFPSFSLAVRSVNLFCYSSCFQFEFEIGSIFFLIFNLFSFRAGQNISSYFFGGGWGLYDKETSCPLDCFPISEGQRCGQTNMSLETILTFKQCVKKQENNVRNKETATEFLWVLNYFGMSILRNASDC